MLTVNLVFSNACARFLQDSAFLIDESQPIYHRYLQIHLHLLETLLDYERRSTSTGLPCFSFQDEGILSRSLSFVVLLGLVLHFDQDVSLSLETYLQHSHSAVYLMKLQTHLTHHDRMSHLDQVLSRMMKWIQPDETHSFVVRRLCSHYFLELVLGHLQLLYSPNRKHVQQEFFSQLAHENFLQLQRHFQHAFIQQLIMLNRLLSSHVKSPLWLKQRCGDQLTLILIDQDNPGIRRVLQVILDSSSSSSSDRLYTSMAQILSTCPKQLTADEYIHRIRSQLIELLHEPRYQPIMSIAINQLFRKYPRSIEREIFSIVLQPLITCRDSPSTGIITTEEQLTLFIDDLAHLTQPIDNEPIRTYLHENYLRELINMYLAVDASLSAVKLPFSALVSHLFASMDTDVSLRCFEAILFRLDFVPLKFLPEQSAQFTFAIEPECDYDPELFSQTLTKLLFSIENNERLIVKLFLSLLQSLITNHDSSGSVIWTDEERRTNLRQIQILTILRRILDYLSEHVDVFIKNLDDTISVIQVRRFVPPPPPPPEGANQIIDHDRLFFSIDHCQARISFVRF